LKIDLHTHTSYGSSCSYMDPDQLVIRAKSVGLDGVCITEHDQLWDEDAIARLGRKHDFLVIGGVEVGTDCGHILVFGLHRSVKHVYYVQDLHDMVAEAGGAMIMAHPFRYEPELVAAFSSSKNGWPAMESVCSREVFQLVDALEIYNGRSGFHEKRLTSLVAERRRLSGTGGSDAHAGLEVGACYSVFEETIRDEKDLIVQLKKGTYHGVDPRWGASL